MTASSRAKILRRISAHPIEPIPHPGELTLRADSLPASTEPGSAIEALIRGTGAETVEHRTFMDGLPEEGVCSLIEEIPSSKELGTGELSRAELLSVRLTLARGSLVVRENGAIWISHRGLVNRGALFTCAELALFLNRSHIVDTMHDAMRVLTSKAMIPGCFVAGPSKTADIEQHLVIGAQGARKVTVVLEGPPSLRAWIGSAIE